MISKIGPKKQPNRSGKGKRRFAAAAAMALAVCVTGVALQGAARRTRSGDGNETGWHALPNTKLASVCPHDDSIHGTSGCAAIIRAWGGGIADTRRNRLLIWGGGHNDYYGNEVYALELETKTMKLLVAPTTQPSPCIERQRDGHPSARHSYSNLAYMEATDTMYSFGGAPACERGMGSSATWTLDLQRLLWEEVHPAKGDQPDGSRGFAVAVYDPTNAKVYLNDSYALWEYDDVKRSYKLRNPDAKLDDGMSGALDVDHQLLVAFGFGKARAMRVGPKGNYSLQVWDHSVKGCDALQGAAYPGLAYDPDIKRIVGWAGGDSVYAFDPETKSCKELTFPNGPGEQQEHGTNGRFAYFPALHVFALVNDWQQDAYLLRLSAAE